MKVFNDLFASFDQQDSLVFLLFVLVAFLLGYLLSWLVYGRQLAKWRQKARAAEAEQNALQAEYQSFKEQYALREADLQHAQVEAEEARRQAQQLKQERSRLEGELEETQAELKRLESTVTSQQVNIEDLNDQVLGLRTKNQELLDQEIPGHPVVERPIMPTSDTGELSGALEAALKRLAAVEERLGKIESENESLHQQLEEIPLARSMQTPVEQLFDMEDEPLDEEEAEAQQVAQARAAIQAALGAALPIASENNKDDLQQIHGIGPFIEKQLNEVGIYTYEQVSQLDELLIEQLTMAIRFFPGRILKDDWVGQASQLFENPPAPAEGDQPLSDNLQEIEGIGPKIEVLLQEAGIRTYEQLAGASVERLEEILHAAGERFRLHDPSTWPDQARLAADEKWDELQTYKEYLNGGN